MSFKVDADLVALFRGLVSMLKPYASAQQVDLSFKSAIKSQYSYYHPEEVIFELTKLLTRVIAFTPQSYKVNVSFNKKKSEENRFCLCITNTGVNLSNITEIPGSVKFKTIVENINNKGTQFKIDIPITLPYDNAEKIHPKEYLWYDEWHPMTSCHNQIAELVLQELKK